MAGSLSRGHSGTPRVVVVGGGLGGIAAGVTMRRAGIESFTIYEQSPSVGGTWFDNQYPGCEVDVGSYLYSYSFKQRFAWSRTHARQPELLRYIEEVVAEEGLGPHLRLGRRVEAAAWDDARQGYEVRLDDGSTVQCEVLISAVGFLNRPAYPSWPGLEDFEGELVHTFRWPADLDLTGKRVAVVGTGSTATQLAPAIADQVAHLTVFQREPGWIIPKQDRDYGDDELRRFSTSALARRLARIRLFAFLEITNFRRALHRPGTKVNQRLEQMCREFIDRELADFPELRAAVTPDYPFPGKRPVFAGDFYATLRRPNVDLVPRAVVGATAKGLIDAEGTEHQFDVIVLATGFKPAEYLASLEVKGRRGRTLQEVWAGEPSAFLGIMVPEFPNFFMLYGPYTNGGEIIFHLEHQARFAVRAMRRMMRHRWSAVEVRRVVFELFDWWMQRNMRGTAWLVANNYYKAPTGKIVTQWPHGPLFYGFLTNVTGALACRGWRNDDSRKEP